MLLGRWQKAIVAFSAALVRDPSNSDLLYNYALALFNLGNTARRKLCFNVYPMSRRQLRHSRCLAMSRKNLATISRRRSTT